MKRGNEQPWQTDPNSIKTSLVQVWSADGIMLTASMTREVAQIGVTHGRYFVISDQAVGQYDN